MSIVFYPGNCRRRALGEIPVSNSCISASLYYISRSCVLIWLIMASVFCWMLILVVLYRHFCKYQPQLVRKKEVFALNIQGSIHAATRNLGLLLRVFSTGIIWDTFLPSLCFMHNFRYTCNFGRGISCISSLNARCEIVLQKNKWTGVKLNQTSFNFNGPILKTAFNSSWS